MKPFPQIPNITTQINAVQSRLQHTQELIVARAAAHILHPSEYPLPADPQSLEHHFVELYHLLSRKGKEQFEKNAQLIMGYMTEDRRNKLGDLANLNHKSTMSTIDQVKQLGTNATMQINIADIEANEHLLRRHMPKSWPGNFSGRTVSAPDPRGQNPRTLSLFVDSVHCENTNDLRKDEISLFGFTIDALGRTSALPTVQVGDFKKGETIPLGSKAKLRDFDLREPGFFPQAYITTLFLLEKDLMHNKALQGKLMLIGSIMLSSLIAVAMILLYLSPIPMVGAPIGIISLICFILSGILYVFMYFLLVMMDDISGATTDQLIFDIPPVVPVGTDFTRKIDFTIEGDLFGVRKAKYNAQLRWERTA